MWWECVDCGTMRFCDPLGGDDWPDGIMRAVGPDCQECECRMDAIPDDEAPPVPAEWFWEHPAWVASYAMQAAFARG